MFFFLGIIACSDGHSLLRGSQAAKDAATMQDLAASGDPSIINPDSMKQFKEDIELIDCVKEDNTHTTFFTRPPLKDLTLFFEDERVEKEYRRLAWKGLKSPDSSTNKANKTTYSPVLMDAYFDMGLVTLFFIVVSIDSLWSYKFSFTWFSTFCMSALTLGSVIFILQKNLASEKSSGNNAENQHPFHLHRTHQGSGLSYVAKVYKKCRGWIPSHCIGILLLALPILIVLSNFTCGVVSGKEDERNRDFYLQMLLICLTHFSNLSSLNYVVKSGFASLFAILVVFLFSDLVCLQHQNAHQELVEVIICISTLVSLVWLMNREFEISYR